MNQPTDKRMGNTHRDLMRRLLRKCTMLLMFLCMVHLLNPATGTVSEHPLSFLLPHEIIYALLGKDPSFLETITQSASPEYNRVAGEFCTRMQIDRRKFVGLGLHSDGVPVGASGRSIEVISWNFAAAPELYCPYSL